MNPLTLLVIGDPAAPYLRLLERLPENTTIIVGHDAAYLMEAAPRADILFNASFRSDLLRAIFPHATRVRWVHAISAGVEGLLSPEIVQSSVPLTNGRGAYKRALAEFAILAALYFAKDVRRLLRDQEAGVWQPYEMEELHGKVLGIVGYGEIGRATAELARAFGMNVLAVRRRPELSGGDPSVDQVFAPCQLGEMLVLSDYVLVAAPNTPETRGLIGEAELRVMKANAVLINVGRGPVIVEKALIRAVEENWIRGAALDVFEHEPLPADHAFYRLKNVFMSPHCADRVPGWLEQAMEFFLANFERFQKGEMLVNVVDKHTGY